MQKTITTQKPTNSFKVDDLPFVEKQKLVSAFAWLIQEDKKQNPEFYKSKKEKNG
jgi:hypothetical protein